MQCGDCVPNRIKRVRVCSRALNWFLIFVLYHVFGHCNFPSILQYINGMLKCTIGRVAIDAALVEE
jgi:hypothetical protein